MDPSPPRFFHALVGERVMLLDIAQRFMNDVDGDGRFETLIVPPAVENPDIKQLPQAPPLPFDDIVNEINIAMSRCKSLCTAKYTEGRAESEKIEKDAKSRKSVLIKVFVPSMTRAFQLECRRRATRNALRVAFFINAWHAKHAQWPKSLDEAVPKDYAGYRKDPFSGKDFVYRVENGQPLLYSVGENGVDDGGTPPAEKGKVWASDGDAILWPPPHD